MSPGNARHDGRSGMRTWVRQHPYLALAFGYFIFLVFTTATWFLIGSRDLVDALLIAFINTVVYVLLALFQIRNVLKTKQRLEKDGQFRAFIRYPDSLPGSLSGIWNQGIATPAAGTIRFQPAVYDSLEPSGRPTEFSVQELIPERRKISGKDRKYMPAYGFRAITLLADGSKVELAASPESLDRLVDIVKNERRH